MSRKALYRSRFCIKKHLVHVALGNLGLGFRVGDLDMNETQTLMTSEAFRSHLEAVTSTS